MKLNNIKYILAAGAMVFGMTSCEDFLDRPTEDNYVAGGYYQTDAECISAVNYLYNSPWYDFQRFFFAGEILAGNLYMTGGEYTPYLQYSLNSNNEHLRNMAYSLWAVNSHSNVVRSYIQGGGASQAVKNQTMGECLLWKGMAYFYLVRIFGEVPIVHDNSAMIAAGDYNEQYKVTREDGYEYVTMILEKAIELLPEQCTQGRLDKYCAKGLLAKVYLTKAGVSGQLNKADLEKAAELAKDVIENSGRELAKDYADVFKLTGNYLPENMIAWRWTVGAQWTSQNTLQSDLGMTNFDEFGDTWGGYSGASIDLQEAFGLTPVDDPRTRIDVDKRRAATYMTAGDIVPYLWQDHGGFDWLRFQFDNTYFDGCKGEIESATGANVVKHLYGNNNDHKTALGIDAARMAYALCTPLLRLSDVYLVYAEAKTLAGQPTDALALEVFNKVHKRGVPTAVDATSLTFEQIWKERRLEFALEGDRWFDFVRLSYYNVDAAIAEIKAQKRNAWWNLNSVYKNYFESGEWSQVFNEEGGTADYDTETAAPNVTKESFTIPFPTEDLTFNPHLAEPAVHIDVREVYSF